MMNGIDIASYQSKIDPAKLTTTDFIIIKFTQGTTYVNPYAVTQYSLARKAGKCLGAYHYAAGKDAKAEARFFVEKIGDRVGECILALDWEGAQNPAFGRNDVAWCRTWLNEVYRLTGVRPFIYMSKSVCRAHDWSSIADDYPLWCAQYGSMNRTGYKTEPWTDGRGFGAWTGDIIRQYSSRGRIAGYAGDLDLDKAYLSRVTWKSMAGSTKKKIAKKEEEHAEMMPTLKKGSTGRAVKCLQIMLGDVTVDGDFGPKTEGAVKTFQKAHGLAQDGVVGVKTWNALIKTL